MQPNIFSLKLGIKMDIKKFSYPAIKIKQNPDASEIILFGASAYEISKWAGVPQKTRFDGVESVGFQRVNNPKRLAELQKFYLNSKNVIQNSLICAIREIDGCDIKFVGEDTGTLEVYFPDFYNMPIVDLFAILRRNLESRVSDKEQLEVTTSDKQKIKRALSLSGEYENFDSINELELDDPNEEEEEEENEEHTEVILDESHFYDFIKEVSSRHEVLLELGEAAKDLDYFLGFTRDVLISFILPVSLVDGQHRLLGAIEETQSHINKGVYHAEIETLVNQKLNPIEINEYLLRKYSRKLPVSLLLSSDPAEQVFQFVVINQKATPIERSLLGTIVSTTLTNDEMEQVSERLRASGIKLEEARAITWMARSEESPFYQLVERGVEAERNDLLQWSVMGKVITIFKELSGGVRFGEKNDYARRWKEKHLDNSNIVSNFSEYGYETPFEYWRSLEGPWREIFVTFWNCVKSKFSQSENPDRFNYWGKPRISNIFNKISLTVLAADFFEYLVLAKIELSSKEQVNDLVDDWLTDVDFAYFDRDWQLSGVKKDSKGIRDRWAEIWSDYRKSPDKLPRVTQYRNPKKV
jgi:hypothetical protein